MPKATCTPCGSEFEIEGASGTCPLCGKPVLVDLSVRVICSCGTTLKAPPRLRGRMLRCPKCTRSVLIPRGDEAEREKASSRIGSPMKWLFPLVLLPFLAASSTPSEVTAERILKTAQAHPESKATVEAATTLGAQLRALPRGRLDKAHLEAGSAVSWGYAAAGLAFLLFFAGFSFHPRGSGAKDLVGPGAVGLVAGAALQGLLHLAWPVPAGNPAGRILAAMALGAVAGEILKGALAASLLRRKKGASWKDLNLAGLAAGAGFGAGTAGMIASGWFNGIATGGDYWTLFLAGVGLQAVWGGTTAIFLWKGREALRTGGLAKIATAAAPSMGLHAITMFFLVRMTYIPALVLGLVAFALYLALHYWEDQTEEETFAGETIKL